MTSSKFVHFGKNLRIIPLACSLVHRCHDLYGSAKNIFIFVCWVTCSCCACSVPLSQVVDLIEFCGICENILIVASLVSSAVFFGIFRQKIKRLFLSISVLIAEYVVRLDKMESHSKCQNSFLFSSFGKNFFLWVISILFGIFCDLWRVLQVFFFLRLCFLVR